MTTAAQKTLPSFKELPLNPSDPPYSAWIWGKNDQLGCLNHLTHERTAAAAKLIRTGVSVGLNWGLHQMRIPPPFRQTLNHKILPISDTVNDDSIEINTQTSSQWDSFRHMAYKDGRAYNGVPFTEIRGNTSQRNGIHEWAKKGVVGRGVLIDYFSYMEESDQLYEPWSGEQITVETVKKIAKQCNITFETGDILFLRTGFVQAYEMKSTSELEALMGDDEVHFPGLAQKKESLEWLWDTHFAAVAADSPGFEAFEGRLSSPSEDFFQLHEKMLCGFGLPIGELFDLEALAEQCKKHRRWEFFVTSEPLNLYGGVASPPNALAIF